MVPYRVFFQFFFFFFFFSNVYVNKLHSVCGEKVISVEQCVFVISASVCSKERFDRFMHTAEHVVEYIALGLRELWDCVTVNVESKLIPHLWSPPIGGVTLMASNTVDGGRQVKC